VKDKMELTALTLLILQLNKLIDSGEYDDITIDEIHNHINDGTILRFLGERGQEGNFSIHSGKTYGDFESFYVKQLQSLYDAYAGDERRKWGVQNKGLCLLLAWTNEIIQKGSGWKPNMNISER
jgi:hypothetical protein